MTERVRFVEYNEDGVIVTAEEGERKTVEMAMRFGAPIVIDQTAGAHLKDDYYVDTVSRQIRLRAPHTAKLDGNKIIDIMAPSWVEIAGDVTVAYRPEFDLSYLPSGKHTITVWSKTQAKVHLVYDVPGVFVAPMPPAPFEAPPPPRPSEPEAKPRKPRHG